MQLKFPANWDFFIFRPLSGHLFGKSLVKVLVKAGSCFDYYVTNILDNLTDEEKDNIQEFLSVVLDIFDDPTKHELPNNANGTNRKKESINPTPENPDIRESSSS